MVLNRYSNEFLPFIFGFILMTMSFFLSSSSFNHAQIQLDLITLENEETSLSALLIYPRNIQESKPRPAILAYHGWGGTKEGILPTCLGLAEAGYVVLAPDLRGHGESEGISELGLVEIKDAKIAIDYLFSRSDLVNTSALSTWGSSFGGLIALLSAGTDPRVNATVATSAPTNLTDWLYQRDFRWQERITYRPYVPVDPQNESALMIRSPVTYIQNITNLLIIHGENDAIVPINQARALYEASLSINKFKLASPILA